MTITNIIDCGTIVIVELVSANESHQVYFDHRMFHDFAESQDFVFTDKEYDTDGETLWEI